MYLDFYQLKEDPFRISPKLGNYFKHPTYTKAKKYIRYVLYRGEGIVLITGRPGTGKSTLVNEVTSLLKENQANVALTTLVCNLLDEENLLRQYIAALGLVPPEENNMAAYLQLLENELRHLDSQSTVPILILDEAQRLTVDALEQVRVLTNYSNESFPLLRIILIGQDELREKILSPALEQLHQRITCACNLRPLTLEETEDYIHHCLDSAGRDTYPLLDTKCIQPIYDASTGIPRWINQIGSRLLMLGATDEITEFSESDVNVVVNDLLSESLLPMAARAS